MSRTNHATTAVADRATAMVLIGLLVVIPTVCLAQTQQQQWQQQQEHFQQFHQRSMEEHRQFHQRSMEQHRRNVKEH